MVIVVNKMKIGVVILNYNSAKDTRKCIEFLQKQKLNEELHVIVVDNSDREQGIGSKEQGIDNSQLFIAKAQRPMVQQSTEVIYADENRGYSAGNNIGLRRAVELGCEYVLVVNPDMELVDPHYIEKLVAVMQADEDVVVAATDIVTPEGIHQNPMLADGNWRSSFGWVTSLLRPQKRAEAYDFIGDYAKSGYCAKVSGCCLMLRCSFLQEIGYFDEYPFLYCEEAILASQVARAGKKMYYLADTQAIHRHVKSEKGDPVKRFRHWQRSRIYFYKRYSNDSWLGRQISILSMRMYVFCFTMYKKVTNIRRQKDIRT